MIDQKRAKNMAIAGALLQLAFAAVTLGIYRVVDSQAALACTLLLAGGLPLWLMAALLSYCRQLQQAEEKELSDIAAAGSAEGRIFRDERGILCPATARAAWMERWIVPIFTILWALYHAGIALLLLQYLSNRAAAEPTASGAAPATLFSLMLAFIAFLFSRYALGMGSQSQWRLLRAAGSYLFINTLAIAAMAAALLGAYQGYFQVDRVVSYIIPLVQLVLAAELALNFVLDIYRPRVPGQEHRYSFDSRLFNFVAEPGRIGHSIAEALNYQFGFEVSKTWFYQLVSRAFVPLVILGSLILLGMSSLVIVDQGERAVLLHWGRIATDRGDAGQLGPGLHLKWPWPVDRARLFNVAAVHEIQLGAGRERTDAERRGAIIQEGAFKGRELSLWTEEHGAREELDFLLAQPPDKTRPATSEEQRPPVSIIKLVVPIHYVITDVVKYGFKAADVDKLLEMEAYRQMVSYCASATLDSPVGQANAERPEAIMTYGRQRATAELKKRIQAAADRLDLGIKIVYVGIEAVHPPAAAASAFEDVLKAERQQDQTRYTAEATANATLSNVAGDPVSALRLALAIRKLDQLERLNNLRDNPSELAKAISEYTRLTGDDIGALTEELARERLLGQTGEGKGQLLADLQAHLDMLKGLAAQGAKADFAAQIPVARKAADALFSQTTGEPAALVAQATARRWTRELSEQARAEAFGRQLQAYRASPNIYMLDRWLDVWDQVLPKINKYVLGVDRRRIEIWLNWEHEGSMMQGAFETAPAGTK
ncbi:MAG: SPFH domain-containing protein [Phycisphaerae bacterium]|jgi:regulator of protease activity HflC (stomatin/prohibitin superfamily)